MSTITKANLRFVWRLSTHPSSHKNGIQREIERTVLCTRCFRFISWSRVRLRSLSTSFHGQIPTISLSARRNRETGEAISSRLSIFGAYRFRKPSSTRGTVSRSLFTSAFRPSSVMFEATCHQFCKSVGRDTLVPVVNLDTSDNVKPLQVVVKTVRRHYFFWEKVRYQPTEFQLAQLLTDTSPVDVPLESKFFLSYDRTTKYSLDGKFGSKFLEELMDVNLEAADSLSVTAKLGDINKEEVDLPKLTEVLKKRKVNLHHDFVQQIRQNPKKVLCVVKGVAELSKSASLSKHINRHGSTDVAEKILESAEVGVKLEYDQDRDMEIPKGNPIAYSVCELQVSTVDGAIEVIIGQGLKGGFKKSVGFGEPDTNSFDAHLIVHEHIQTVLHPILSLPTEQRHKLTTNLFCLFPSMDDITLLCEVLEKAEADSGYKLPVEDLEKKLVTRKDIWQDILSTAGFSGIDKGVLTVDSDKKQHLDAFGYVFDALEELNSYILNLIRNCDPNKASSLIRVLDQALEGSKTFPDSSETCALLADNAARKLLLHLGFQVKSGVISPPSTLPTALDEVYWIVYALWGSSS